jgi:alpha-1,2-glucosyltransferase
LNVDNNKSNIDVLLETITLASLPPMYFFAHVYYTDVPSITMILFMVLFSLTRHHKLSSFFAACSVLMRQTNIVWVTGTLGVHLVDKMMHKIYPKMKREHAKFSNFLFALKSHLKHPTMLANFIFDSVCDFYGYILVIVGFIVFLVKNGSIVGEFHRIFARNLLIS